MQYGICTVEWEIYNRFGSIQPVHFMYGSQTIDVESSAEIITFDVFVSPKKTALNENRNITIDRVELSQLLHS